MSVYATGSVNVYGGLILQYSPTIFCMSRPSSLYLGNCLSSYRFLGALFDRQTELARNTGREGLYSQTTPTDGIHLYAGRTHLYPAFW